MLIRRDGDKNWREPQQVGYPGEVRLQEVLASSPQLLGNAELAVVREFPLVAGYLDVLGVGPGGEIVLCECKLRANADSRRAVVGQLVSYAGALWELSYDDFAARFARLHGGPLEDAVADRTDADLDIEAFRSAVAATLHSGEFTLIIALDHITDELTATLRFLGARGTPIVGLELAYRRDTDIEILAPRWVQPTTTPPPPRRPTHTEETLLEALNARCTPAAVQAVLALRDGLTARGARLAWGHGASPSLTFWVSIDGSEQPLFVVNAYLDALPTLEVAFRYLAVRGVSTDRLAQIATSIRTIPRAAEKLAGLEDADFRRGPGLGLDAVIAQPGAVDTLIALVDSLDLTASA